MSRIIDLVIVEEEYILTYELKIKNWRKAIEQMKNHRIASSFCYLCMPKKSISDKLALKIKNELKFYGFGFKLWDEDSRQMEILLKARRSEFLFHTGIAKLKQNIEVLSCQQ
jgi:hypothetical protein